MADLFFPSNIRKFTSVAFDIRGTARGGGRGITGMEQVVPGPAGMWVATLTLNIGIMAWNGSDEFLSFNALKSRLRGRANVVTVPYPDPRGPMVLAGLPYTVPHSDGTTFSDGSSYAQPSIPVALTSGASKNATTLVLTWPEGMQPLPGQVFTLPGGWMHSVSDLIARNGNDWTVSISPWLRANYLAGAAADFDRPTCRMRLLSDESGTLTRQAGQAWGAPTLELVEAF